MIDPQQIKQELVQRLEKHIKHLRIITDPCHDAIEHCYEENPDQPGVCIHCGWLHEERLPRLECGHTTHDHALAELAWTKITLAHLRQLNDQELAETITAFILLVEKAVEQETLQNCGFSLS